MYTVPPHPRHQLRILFILNKRQSYEYGGWVAMSTFPTSSGLYNSALFVVEMLRKHGYAVQLVQVTDSNSIDREVTQFRPSHVVLEAIWVPPPKFKELVRLHPNVKWVIRIHSEIPFLANEGLSLTWLPQYVQYDNVSIAANSPRALEELRLIVAAANPTWSRKKIIEKVIYLPNYYPLVYTTDEPRKNPNDFFDVGCFGAIRPMKNQLIQGVAAVDAAHRIGKKLRFHVNGTRIEQGGESILKNLQALMKATHNELVIEPWSDHDDFVKLLRKMDVGMQVSFSETFNIVAADMVMAELPIVVSSEVQWACSLSQADPTNSKEIARTLEVSLRWPMGEIAKRLNVKGLKRAGIEAQEIWLVWVGGVNRARRHFGADVD